MDSKESEKKEVKEDKTTNPAIILKFKKSSYLKRFGCSVCSCSYTQMTNLKYHIRRDHYNLIAKINKREKRNINDVWLERVVNTDEVIEITKTGHNKYLMKKSSNADCIEIAEPTDTMDLTGLYPDCARKRYMLLCCCICKQRFLKSDYTKHLENDHEDLML